MERIREFATLKVLGFYPKEIRALVIRENIALTIICWIVRMQVGLLFLKGYIGIVSAQNMEFFIVKDAIRTGLSTVVEAFS